MITAFDTLKTDLVSIDPTAPVQVTIGTHQYSFGSSTLAAALGVTQKAPTSPTPAPQPTIAYQARVNSDIGLRVREAPSTSSAILGGVANNDLVDVYSDPVVNANNLNWLHIRTATGIEGWSAALFLVKITTPAPAQPTVSVPPSPAPQPRHRLGIHCLQDARPAVDNWLASGVPPASATVINDVGLANELAALGITTIYRSVLSVNEDQPQIPNDPVAAAAFGTQWIQSRFQGRFQALDPRVYVQPVNECGYGPGHPAFIEAVMQWLETHGRRAAIGAYSVGTPEPAQWSQLAPALAHAKANGHIVVLHAYCAPNTPPGQLSGADSQYYELRFPRLYNAVGSDSHPPLVLSEFGGEFSRGKFQGTGALLSLCTAFEAATKGLDYLVGYNLWTVGSAGGWGDASIDSALPQLAAWSKG